ncbi:ATP-dependent DNA helicase RecQ [Tilletia horrida]|uniref:ATP-dependent DNA helicase RecQ n=1 Tax=Tilletia horrida TaxID=155126 RepID=A0AAN6JNP0_9BASI|nr:ATP-dependent DNA helicase RecQ [Tilletia horrida]
MAGTSAFGPGIDPPNVIWTATINVPHSMMSQEQLAGRAGRGGQLAFCYTFLPDTSVISTTPTIHPTSDAEALHSYLSTDVCMRAVTSSWLDGRAATCLELGAQPCGVCQGQLKKKPVDHNKVVIRPDKGEQAVDQGSGRNHNVTSNAVAGSSKHPMGTQEEIMASSARFAHLSDKYKRKGVPDSPESSTKKVRVSEPHQSTSRLTLPAQQSWPMSDSDEDEDHRTSNQGPASSPIEQFSQPSSSRLMLPARVGTAWQHYQQMLHRKINTGASLKKLPARKTTPRKKPEPVFDEAAVRKYFDDRLSDPFGHSKPVKPGLKPVALPVLSAASPLRQIAGSRTTPASSSASEDEIEQATQAASIASHDASGVSASSLGTLTVTHAHQNKAELLQSWTRYRAAVLSGLTLTEDACPICDALELPAGHSSSHCPQAGLDFQSQVDFRKSIHNQWGYGQACFFCNLPQDICGRRNDEKTCDLSKYKDTVKIIIMFLTLNRSQLEQAVEYARLINPSYNPGPPHGPSEMGDWRQLEYFLGRPTYMIFQAVAMVLIRFAGQI